MARRRPTDPNERVQVAHAVAGTAFAAAQLVAPREGPTRGSHAETPFPASWHRLIEGLGQAIDESSTGTDDEHRKPLRNAAIAARDGAEAARHGYDNSEPPAQRVPRWRDSCALLHSPPPTPAARHWYLSAPTSARSRSSGRFHDRRRRVQKRERRWAAIFGLIPSVGAGTGVSSVERDVAQASAQCARPMVREKCTLVDPGNAVRNQGRPRRECP